jgi:hypothetical protein
MDTMTYASVAVLPWSVAQQDKRPVAYRRQEPMVPEPYKFQPFDLQALMSNCT